MLPIKEDPHLHSPQSSPRRHRVLLVDEDAKDLEHFRLSQIHNITLLIANAKANTPVSVKT